MCVRVDGAVGSEQEREGKARWEQERARLGPGREDLENAPVELVRARDELVVAARGGKRLEVDEAEATGAPVGFALDLGRGKRGYYQQNVKQYCRPGQ